MLSFGLFAIATESDKPEPLLGDESDGSMKAPVHIIPLFPEKNEKGDKGSQIKADTKEPLPFSTRLTCGECHSYDTIKHGWHFNSVDSNVPAGRPGEPWIYFDSKLCTQIPLSYRSWPGTFKPEQIGLSDFKFTSIFGRQMPGGGPGEVTMESGDDYARQFISGKLEVNCLVCHDGHYGLNMGSVTGYSVQVSTNQNFRWAAAASSEFAEVAGSAAKMDDFYDPFIDTDIKVNYKKEAFNTNNEVLFDIVREVPNDRCYYCHSNLYEKYDEKTEKWTQDVDVHIAAGLKCVDCHRNGLDHDITRGYPGEEGVSDNPMVPSSTCEGCHLPKGDDIPKAGRLGAPIPKHQGIPSVHFEKLTCTACHSGPWPQEETVYTKTSRAHRLGTPNVNKDADALPHIMSPVIAKQQGIFTADTSVIQGEKLAPYKMVWPSFWAVIDNNEVKPIEISVVTEVIKPIFDKLDLTYREGWPQLTNDMIKDAIIALNKNKSVKGKAAYVSAGKLYSLDYSLDDGGKLVAQENEIAKPYLWPIAHNVRPAAQALGVRYCTDCHEAKSGFLFGKVKVDSPVADEWLSTRKMIEYEGLDSSYMKAFAFSFVFRPMMKIICICCSLVIAGVLLLYALRLLLSIAKVFGKGN